MKETNRSKQRENKTNVEQKERVGNKGNEREREREQIHRKDRRKCSQSEAINKQMRNTKKDRYKNEGTP